MKRIILLTFAIVSTLGMWAQGYQPSEAIQRAQREFQDKKFGIFLHWGIYSMLGQGEWVMQNRNINYKEYPKIANGFYPSKFNADEWVQAIKASGAKYITITSRHHDGFSMWNSAASDYNIVKATPFKRDVLKELSDACQRHGIALHFYYSHLDWGRLDYPLGRTGLGTGRPKDKQDWKHYFAISCANCSPNMAPLAPFGSMVCGITTATRRRSTGSCAHNTTSSIGFNLRVWWPITTTLCLSTVRTCRYSNAICLVKTRRVTLARMALARRYHWNRAKR